MTPDYQPRYLAYCAAHGKTPEEMLSDDRSAYPGGVMCGYIIWIGSKWREWDRLTKHVGAHTEADHVAFDKWLEAQ